ncbi:MAG: protein kinase [Deltaproteobacteria bacterium]
MERIGGYEILRELSRGRAGPRYVASNPRSDDNGAELVALTVLDVEWVRDPAYLTILNAEAASAIHFDHPAAARVLEVNRIDDAVAVAVELVDGQPLSEVLDRTAAHSTRMPWAYFVWVGVQIAKLLQVAHATPWADGEVKGMYHGQLCPSDVYLTYDGGVKVNGVGLGRSRSRLPLSSARLPYHAPELFDRHKADHLTDIYGLGIVLNDAIRGRTTFSKPTDAAMRRAIATQTVPPLHLDVPDIPSALATLLGSTLAKMPSERPSSLFEIERTLASFLDHDEAHYTRGIAEHMTSLFKSSARATPPPPVMLREPPPINAPPDEPWGQDSGEQVPPMPVERAPVDDGFVDEMAVEELVEAIVAQRVRQTAPSFTSTRPRAIGAQTTPPPRPSPPPRAAPPPPRAAPPPPELPREEPPSEPPDSTPPAAPPPNGHASALLDALDSGPSSGLDSLIDAIVAGSDSTPMPDDAAPPPSSSQPSMEPPELPDDDDSGFEIERNETPFPEEWSKSQSTPQPDPYEPPRRPPESRSDPQGTEPYEPRPPQSRSNPILPPFEPPTPREGSRSQPDASSSSPDGDLVIEDPVTLPPYQTSEPSDDAAPGPTAHKLSPGDVVSGRYRIIGVLGEGGVSVVYRAEHMLLGKPVALKVMRWELSEMPAAKERFQLEARSVCRLDHPNIVRVTDFGYASDGRMFLVMDVVEGESLASLLHRTGPLDIRLALAFIRHILAGLKHAHAAGLVHRDLKPENVVITEREGSPIPKILDFGIAKITDRDGARSITKAGMVFGTPRYMSPEQAAGEEIDLRTDLYTLGVILYQMLTGHVPFDGGSTVQILSRVLTQPPPPMRLPHPNREAARAVEDLVMRALEKERDARFADTTEFAASIDALVERYGV